MGSPKFTKRTDLRRDLFRTLEKISEKSETHIVSTSVGDVVILSKTEYDSMSEDLELFRHFEDIESDEHLISADEIFGNIERKFPYLNEVTISKKIRKKSL